MPPHVHDHLQLGGRLSTVLPQFAKARQLAQMTLALHESLRSPWANHLRIVNLRADVVVIFASSAPALLSLRSSRQAVLDFLNARYGLQCRKIEAKVVPPPQEPGRV
jgi:hypothetical protein